MHQSKEEQDVKPLKLSLQPRAAMAFYEEDDKVITELVRSIKKLSGDATFASIVRKAVHVGLPIILKQWEPILKQQVNKDQ